MQFAWHVHHDVLVEALTEAIENRVAHIQKSKPVCEVETRLRLLKLVRGELPKAVVETCVAYKEAWMIYREDRGATERTWGNFEKARSAWNEAMQTNLPAIEELHRQECPNCPWDGKTIFPEVRPW